MNRPARSSRQVALLALAVSGFLLGGCAQQYPGPAASTLPDGSYTGQSAIESDGTYGVVSFTVAGGAITEASFVTYDEDGTAHDESYGLGPDGKPTDAAFYDRAQAAVSAEKQFVSEFVETGDQNEVDTIAGASLSYRLFRDAIAQAIGQASDTGNSGTTGDGGQ